MATAFIILPLRGARAPSRSLSDHGRPQDRGSGLSRLHGVPNPPSLTSALRSLRSGGKKALGPPPAGRKRKLLQPSRLHPVDPPVEMDRRPLPLEAPPNRRVLKGVLHLSDHVHAGESVRPGLLPFHSLQRLSPFPGQVPDRSDPTAHLAFVEALNRRLHTAAAGMAAHDEMPDFQDRHGVFQNRPGRRVTLGEEIRDVPVNEELTRQGPSEEVQGLSRIAAAHKEEGRLLPPAMLAEGLRILPDPLIHEPKVPLQEPVRLPRSPSPTHHEDLTPFHRRSLPGCMDRSALRTFTFPGHRSVELRLAKKLARITTPAPGGPGNTWGRSNSRELDEPLRGLDCKIRMQLPPRQGWETCEAECLPLPPVPSMVMNRFTGHCRSPRRHRVPSHRPSRSLAALVPLQLAGQGDPYEATREEKPGRPHLEFLVQPADPGELGEGGRHNEVPEDGSGWWMGMLGEPEATRLFGGLWTLHLYRAHDGLSAHHLVGGTWWGFFGSTFINSHEGRTFAAGLARTVVDAQRRDAGLSLGYRAGALQGYDGRLHPLAERWPVIPAAELTLGLRYRSVGVQLNWALYVASVGGFVALEP